jgi:hypothetical protein
MWGTALAAGRRLRRRVLDLRLHRKSLRKQVAQAIAGAERSGLPQCLERALAV